MSIQRIKLHHIDKATLDINQTLDISELGMESSIGFTISHYLSLYNSAEATLPFEIEGVNKHITSIKDVEFALVIRKKIDLTAIGPNGNTINNAGNDSGRYGNNRHPYIPLDLPSGFTELYRS
jgi:hypothetical protein